MDTFRVYEISLITQIDEIHKHLCVYSLNVETHLTLNLLITAICSHKSLFFKFIHNEMAYFVQVLQQSAASGKIQSHSVSHTESFLTDKWSPPFPSWFGRVGELAAIVLG